MSHEEHSEHIAELKKTVRKMESHLARTRLTLADIQKRLRPEPTNEIPLTFPEQKSEQNAA